MATAARESAKLSAPEGDPAVLEAIASIVARLQRVQAGLTGTIPATDAGSVSLDSWLARYGEVRGRGAHFRYLGSGLGNGALVQLTDGSVKWDMISGIGVNAFGHGDPQLTRVALEAALSDVCQQGNLQFNADSIEFAEELVSAASKASRLRHCFVSNSGCMVNEAALKTCQQHTHGAPRVIAFEDCFMGRSTTMAQIGDGPAYRQGIALNVQVDYMPFYNAGLGARSTELAVRQLRKYLQRYPRQHACFVFELVQGEGGFNCAPPEFFTALMEETRAAGVPVWVDEIQTFGRTESMFQYEALGLGDFVDVLTLGKLSQACALLYTPEFNPKAGLLSGTFTASTSALRVGLSVLRRLQSGGYYGADGRIARLHQAFRTRVDALVRTHPAWFPAVIDSDGVTQLGFVGGTGGMMRFTPFGGEKERINRAIFRMFDLGVIAFACGHGPYHIRMLPPIGVMTPEQFAPVFEIIERALGECS
ncbi:MAG: aminotransferase class III-fold pyridoxal phosphate-dependent enzyme [Phycisphaerales bacterium]|nr:aminotransferase class III-fold pyridoxal phosphate-dependent enzyme [Phycisphaerales bacterium]